MLINNLRTKFDEEHGKCTAHHIGKYTYIFF